jgi:hypothetical protein
MKPMTQIKSFLFAIRDSLFSNPQLVGFILLICGVVITILDLLPNYLLTIPDVLSNISSEFIGIGIGVLVIDYANERRANQEVERREQERRDWQVRREEAQKKDDEKKQKWRLKHLVRSQNYVTAINAIEELALQGWLYGEWYEEEYDDYGGLGALNEADLHDLDLHNAKLDRADLEESLLDRTNLKGAKLRGARLNRARLRKANLQGADLTLADLSHADLSWANLKGAELNGTWFLGATLLEADLEGAKVSDMLPMFPVFNRETKLPDGKFWDEDEDMDRFTKREHSDFWRSPQKDSPAYEDRSGF